MKHIITAILFLIACILTLIATTPLAIWTWKWKEWLNAPDLIQDLIDDEF